MKLTGEDELVFLRYTPIHEFAGRVLLHLSNSGICSIESLGNTEPIVCTMKLAHPIESSASGWSRLGIPRELAESSVNHTQFTTAKSSELTTATNSVWNSAHGIIRER